MSKAQAVFLVLLVLPIGLAAESDPAELEARLAEAEGRARIELLVELTSALGRKDPARAAAFGSEALELLRSVPDRELEIALHNSRSAVRARQAEFDRAREHALRAGELARAAGDRSGLARALLQEPAVHRFQSRYETGFTLALEAIDLYRELGDAEGLGSALRAAGNAQQKLSNYTLALEYYQRAHGPTRKPGTRGEARRC